ncbi:hypothetical protein BDW68DRAFT_192277 [Aspergillus falconensis]
MATVVLNPSSWLISVLYEPFLNTVSPAGHSAICADHPSLDPVDPTTAGCKADADALSKILPPFVNYEGPDVLLVMHSYSGMPCAAATKGLSRTECLGQGEVSESLLCWILPNKLPPNLNIPEDCVANFTATIDKELLRSLKAYIKRRITWADDAYAARLSAIVTTADATVPKDAQYGIVAVTQEWFVEELDACHCAPFISSLA